MFDDSLPTTPPCKMKVNVLPEFDSAFSTTASPNILIGTDCHDWLTENANLSDHDESNGEMDITIIDDLDVEEEVITKKAEDRAEETHHLNHQFDPTPRAVDPTQLNIDDETDMKGLFAVLEHNLTSA